MKFAGIAVFASILAVTPLAITAPAAGNTPYADPGQCVTIQLMENYLGIAGYSVVAECSVVQGGSTEWICSQLSLNSCYINTDGNLVPLKWGNFGDSCRNCVMEDTRLTCYCSQYNGQPDDKWVKAITETNDLIVNVNGVMQCFDVAANITCSPSDGE